MGQRKLREIPGKKLRWQHLTMLLYTVVCLALMALTAVTFMHLQDNTFGSALYFAQLGDGLFAVLFLSAPMIVLAIANRFVGKIVCVLDENGLYYDGGVLAWRDIRAVTYVIELPSLTYHACCHARITGTYVNGQTVDITLHHVPHSLLRQIQKRRPQATVRMSRFSRLLFWGLPSAAVILTVICMLLPEGWL